MARISRKALKRDELVEATKEAEHWLEEHWRIVAQIAAVLVALALIVSGWFWYNQRGREKAIALLAEGQHKYAQAETAGFADATRLEEALASFDGAARKGGSSSAGIVARYYQGVVLHQLGRDEEALRALEEAVSRPDCPPTLLGSARAMLAEVYLSAGDVDQAIRTLEALIDADPPTYPVDQALLVLGKIHQQNGDHDQAQAAWNRVVKEFPARGSVDEARRLLAGL